MGKELVSPSLEMLRGRLYDELLYLELLQLWFAEIPNDAPQDEAHKAELVAEMLIILSELMSTKSRARELIQIVACLK